ncbi:hypothetical protein [Amazonocrinis nigriterrae]|nr:hypothetical protein [Amazonocrinis nigriterrae]
MLSATKSDRVFSHLSFVICEDKLTNDLWRSLLLTPKAITYLLV